MGIAAGVAASVAWAISATLMASQATRIDFLTISAIRLAVASVVFAILIFPFDAQGQVTSMPLADVAALGATGVLSVGIGDGLYIAAIGLLGMNRAYPIGLGLFAFLSFVLSITFLGEVIDWRTVVGSAMILLGIYIVAFRGRRAPASQSAPVAAAVGIATGTAAEPFPALEEGLVESARPEIGGGSTPATPSAPALPEVVPDRLVRALQRLPALPLGLGLLVIAAILWSSATVWLRDVGAPYESAAIGLVRMPSAAIALGLMAGAYPGSALRRRRVPRRALTALGAAAVVGTAFGSLLFIVSLQELGAGQAAVLTSMSPLFALPLAAIFLKERLTRWLLVGTALAAAGIALLS